MKYKTLLGITALLILINTSVLFAQNSPAYEALEVLKVQLDEAVQDADRKKIRIVIDSLESQTSHSELSHYAHYYLAYGWYRLYNFSSGDPGNRQSKYLENSIQHAQKTLTIDPDFVEANIILGNAYGVKAERSVFAGIRFGNKAKNLFEEALNKEPSNPRAAMFVGVGTLYKPVILGGSASKAIEQLIEAASLFEVYQPSDNLLPNWGHAELYAWLGQAYEKTDAYDNALQAYQKALTLHPGYRWVRDKLLPDLKKKRDN